MLDRVVAACPRVDRRAQGLREARFEPTRERAELLALGSSGRPRRAARSRLARVRHRLVFQWSARKCHDVFFALTRGTKNRQREVAEAGSRGAVGENGRLKRFLIPGVRKTRFNFPFPCDESVCTRLFFSRNARPQRRVS